MKKVILLYAAMGFSGLFCIHSNAQTPDWQWAQGAGSNSFDYANSIVTDGSGNSYTVGYFNSSMTFDNSITVTSAGSADMYIVKFNNAGNVVWAQRAGGNNDDRAYSVAVDESGNSYVAGFFRSSTIIFGSFTLTNAGNNSWDMFLVKFDPDGVALWAKSAGGTGDDRAYGVALDPFGNCFVTGYFVSATITFGAFTLTNSGGLDVFTVKYATNDGTALWARSSSGTDWEYGNSVAADKSGNCFLTGYFRGTSVTFGTFTLTNSNSSFYDVFIVKYAVDGTVLWAQRAGGTFNEIGNSVAVDTSGNCFLAGSFESSTITFGNITLTNAASGTQDMFIVKYNPIGSVLWANSVGGDQDDGLNSIVVDTSGNSYLVGFFKSASITIGSETLTNSTPGLADLFIAEYSSGGNPLWAKSAGGTGDDIANSIAIDASRNSFVAGYFGSPTLAFGTITLINAGNSDTFITKLENYTGIDVLNNQMNISVFPNPATNKITINIPQKATIEILNIEGRILKTIINEGKEETVDLANLSRGLYLLKVETDGGFVIKKFIKQ
jgi:hypothetical protein